MTKQKHVVTFAAVYACEREAKNYNLHYMTVHQTLLCSVTCAFHEEENGFLLDLPPWTMRQEEDTILFIYHGIFTMGLNLDNENNYILMHVHTMNCPYACLPFA